MYLGMWLQVHLVSVELAHCSDHCHITLLLCEVQLLCEVHAVIVYHISFVSTKATAYTCTQQTYLRHDIFHDVQLGLGLVLVIA